MPIYKYKARDKFGKAVTGVMEALDSEMAASQVDDLGYIPVSIQEKKKDVISLDFLQRYIKVSVEDLILFSRQLSTLFSAGIPLLSGLNTLAEQTENKRMKETINTVRNDVEGGSSLSDALRKHPRVFSALYVGMIQAGETAGTLDEILDRLATITEHEKDTRARIKEATRYPKMVITAISAAFIVLVTFVIPKFATMFNKLGGTLPLPTRVMININHIIHHYWYLMVVVTAAIVLGFRWYTNTRSGRLKWDGLKLRIPVFGPLFLKIAMSRFTHILGMLMRSGVPILDILEITSATVDNTVIIQEIHKLRESVMEGSGLSQPLKKSGIFTPTVTQMISVGEQSGKLDEMMDKVSKYYDLEVEYTIKNLSTLIEPVLIVVIGGMVLFLALAIFLPMWDMA
ncbi:MAG: type II secretion system F family protein, partial [Desulfobacteraceae bacterium]|nr:type II secretion system F family protein [Desulfobacteraceae bacterium]